MLQELFFKASLVGRRAYGKWIHATPENSFNQKFRLSHPSICLGATDSAIYLFAGSLRAGQRAATVMSLVQSLRMNG